MLVAIYHLQDVERARARRLVIREQSIVVGSDPSCTIVIDDDPLVVPKHARFVIRAVDFVVDSLGGAILVNGTPITGATACRPGDSVQLGETVVKLRPETSVVSTEEVPARPRPPTEPWEAGSYHPPVPPFRPPVGNPTPPQPPRDLRPPLLDTPRPTYNPPAPEGYQRRLPPVPVTPPKIWRLVLSSDPTEQAFLVTLRARPGDTATRMVYADWLEERGYVAKAELVRGDSDRDHADLLGESDASWRAITSTATVEQCEVRDCPQRWDAFHPTPNDERVRSCITCSHQVRFCIHVLDLTGATSRNERAVRDAAISGDPDPGDTLDDSPPVPRR